MNTADTPECAASKCSSYQNQINAICQAEGWSVGHGVLVCDTTGYCCECECTASSTARTTALHDLPECPEDLAYSVQGYIDRACREAGTDSIAIVFGDGSMYRAYKL